MTGAVEGRTRKGAVGSTTGMAVGAGGVVVVVVATMRSDDRAE